MVTFTVTATNAGPSPATGVVVTDALPAGLTLVSATPSQGVYTAPAWTVGDVNVGVPATLTIVASVDAPGALVNQAAEDAADRGRPQPDERQRQRVAQRGGLGESDGSSRPRHDASGRSARR